MPDSQTSLPPRRIRGLTLLLCLALAVLVWTVFGQARGFGFIALDDDRFVENNPALRAGLSWNGVVWAFTANLTQFVSAAEYWEPLTLLTRLADYTWHGFDAGGHHRTSVVLHLAATLTLFGALWQLTGARWRSAAVAALFAVHPMNVEPVLWLSARKDVVAGLMYFLALWAYGWHAARPGRGRLAVLVLAVLSANLAKPMAVSLPFVMLVLDFWPLKFVRPGEEGWRIRLRRLTLAKLPFFIVAVFVSVLAILVQRHIGAMADDALLPLSYRIGNAALALATYFWKTLVPIHLTLFYPHPGRSLDVRHAGAAGLLLLLLTLFVVRQWPRRPWLAAGWAWFLVVLAPVCGVIQVGDQAMADRYGYLALIGLFLAGVWQVGEWAVTVERRRCAVGGLIALVGLFASLAFQQVRTWHDSVSVFSHALAVTDDNYLAHFNLGSVLWDQGKRDEAMVHLRKAGQLRRPFLEYQLAAADRAIDRGDLPAAIVHLVRFKIWWPWDPTIHHRIGTLLLLNREPGKALGQFNDALKYRPDWNEPRYAIARVLIAQGDRARARTVLNEALRAHPDDSQARDLLRSIAPDSSPAVPPL